MKPRKKHLLLSTAVLVSMLMAPVAAAQEPQPSETTEQEPMVQVAAAQTTQPSTITEQDLEAYLQLLSGSLITLEEGRSRLTAQVFYTPGVSDFGGSVYRSAQTSASFARGLPGQVEIAVGVDTGFYSQASWEGDTTLSNFPTEFSVDVRKAFVPLNGGVLEHSIGLGYSSNGENSVYRANVIGVASIDPMLLTGSVEVSYDDARGEPTASVTGGVVFAVNRQVALGASVSWSTDFEEFNESVDRVALAFDVSVVHRDIAFTPSIQLGLDETSPAVAFGIGVTRVF